MGKWALGVEAKVAQEVRPADLAAGGVEVVIGPPTIRADDRLGFAEQCLGLLAVTGGCDPEHGRLLREGAPESALFTRLFPAGLIDADDRGAAKRIAEPFLRL